MILLIVASSLAVLILLRLRSQKLRALDELKAQHRREMAERAANREHYERLAMQEALGRIIAKHNAGLRP